jgi:hypothetical protein
VDLFGEFCVCMNFLGFCDLCFDFGIGFSLIWKLIYLGVLRHIRSGF